MSVRASSRDPGPAGMASSPLPASLSVALARTIAPHDVVVAYGPITPHDVIAPNDVVCVVLIPVDAVAEQVAPYDVVEIETRICRIVGPDEVLSPHDVVTPDDVVAPHDVVAPDDVLAPDDVV